MIIKKLILFNFGVYAGENIFEFEHKEPIVLIGGMNGRGKTTFLEAILLSLYGDNSIAFKESKYRSYSQYLRSYVNKSHWIKSSYIELEFYMDDGSDDTYLIRREWDALTKIAEEQISVWQNGKKSNFLAQNWSMFIENILPIALSSFYFFDGEKIAELAVDSTNVQMKNSIRSMLGITVLDVLKNDLNRSLRKNRKKLVDDEAADALELLRSEKDSAIEEVNKIDKIIAEKEVNIERLQEEASELKKLYEQKGGAALEERQTLLHRRAVIKAELDQNAESLLEASASELPLVLVKDLIAQIKLEAEDEHDALIMNQALSQMEEYLTLFESKRNTVSTESRDFIEFVQQQSQISNAEVIYEVSDQGLFQLNSLVESDLEKSLSNVNECLRRKKELLSNADEIDSYLALDINEKELKSILEKSNEVEKAIIALQVEVSHLQQERSVSNALAITKTAEFNKVVEAFLKDLELRDDTERIVKYTDMALKLVDAYSVRLQEKKTGVLGACITECYKKLANKKNLIQRIEMNPSTLEMTYLDEAGSAVSKDSLSAGEKQLMVIAILWALALCSQKKLPVIIDTPLSRLDSQHRAAIVTTYFPNASNQTIILSTDTEIDRTYYNMMKQHIGDEFTLNYSEDTKSTSIEKGYFQY